MARKSNAWPIRLFTLSALLCAAATPFLLSSSSVSAQENYEDFLKGDRREVTEIEGEQVWEYESSTLIAIFGKLINAPVIAPKQLGGKSFLHSGPKLEETEYADQLIANILHASQHAVVLRGGVAQILPFHDAGAMAPTATASSLDSFKAYEVVKLSLPVSGDAWAVRDQVAQLTTPGLGKVLAFEGKIVVVDYVDNIKSVVALVGSSE